MLSRNCVCCGERFSEQSNVLSRNPNICASCSSMADGLEDFKLPGQAELAQRQPIADDEKTA